MLEFVISIIVLLSPFVLYIYFRNKRNLIFVADIYVFSTFLLIMLYIAFPHLFHEFFSKF